MMVYLLFVGENVDGDGRVVEGVFLTKELAEEAGRLCGRKEFEVEEWPVATEVFGKGKAV